MLLDLLRQGSSENTEEGGLRSLNKTVQVLSPRVLDMLAEKLQQLERLKSTLPVREATTAQMS